MNTQECRERVLLYRRIERLEDTVRDLVAMLIFGNLDDTDIRNLNSTMQGDLENDDMWSKEQ